MKTINSKPCCSDLEADNRVRINCIYKTLSGIAQDIDKIYSRLGGGGKDWQELVNRVNELYNTIRELAGSIDEKIGNINRTIQDLQNTVNELNNQAIKIDDIIGGNPKENQ